MKLLSIKLTNFRQFKGSQSFPLDTDERQPVTLLFGANGSGKTTLLNAFTWALYGSLSEDVELQERMVSDVVWRGTPLGGRVPLEVEVDFDYQGHHHRVRRFASVRKDADEQPPTGASVTVWRTAADGRSEELPAPQQVIDSILPPRVSRFFFFNGERIEKLAQKGAYAEVREDIKGLLGLTQVERALDHLPKVERKLGADIRRHGGERAAGIQEAIDRLTDDMSTSRQRIADLKAELDSLKHERSEVRTLLAEHADAAPLQQQRTQVEAELAEAQAALRVAMEERKGAVATRGFLAFTSELAHDTISISRALYEKGALPAPLKRDFVESLLEDNECICGTPLTDGSAAWLRVTDWRQKAGLAEVEAAWQRLEAQVDQIAQERDGLRSGLERMLNRVTDERNRVHRLEERGAELRQRLASLPMEDVTRLTAKENDLDIRISEKNRAIGEAESTFNSAYAEHERQVLALSKAEVKDGLAARARGRQEIVRAVAAALQEILAVRIDDMARRLDTEVKRVFASITAKPFIPALDADFELGLYHTVDGVRLPVARSTGENQILSLSFVAAVSTVAREIRTRRDAEDGLPDDWGTYPIVMDAAFGSLDQSYQRDVSRALASMAPQMIVLVSKSQGLGEVIRELGPRTKNMGVIVTHSTNSARDSEQIELDGQAYAYLETQSSADWSELRSVDR